MLGQIRDIFQCRNDAEYALFIEEHIRAYIADGGVLSAPDTDEAFLRILLHYVRSQRPVSEHNIETVLKLLGASYKEKGYRTPFWALIREAAAKDRDDEIFARARSLEQEIGNEDIDELFDFMEYELLRGVSEEQAEADLGLLAVCRVRYKQSRARNIRMRERPKKKEKKGEKDFLAACESFVHEYTPRRIKEYLDRFVLGQEEAKLKLSTTVYNHFLRILHPEEKLIKTNLLMIGPSGCGKTELIRRISEIIPLPVVTTDFSGIVATPWKGRNKEESLLNLYIKAGRDVELTECGIVFCDEFDKIIPSRPYAKGGDVNHELQGQLLGMFEGTEMEVPLSDKNSGNESIMLNTENILFICAGAFEGLEEIVKKDYVKGGIGFNSDAEAGRDFEMKGSHLKTEHLIEYGMKPELAGRLSTVTVLKALDDEMLKRVLTEPEDSILSRYKMELRIEDDVQLSLTPSAINEIIAQVSEMSIGARGLNAVLRRILSDVLYEAPSRSGVSEVLISGAVIRGEEEPLYVPKRVYEYKDR